MAKHSLKILRYSHRKIFKVDSTIFVYVKVNTIELRNCCRILGNIEIKGNIGTRWLNINFVNIFTLRLDCFMSTEVQKIINNTKVPSFEEMNICVKRFSLAEEITCNFFYPKCLYESQNGITTYIRREVCSESCRNFRKGCNQVIKYIEDTERVISLCKIPTKYEFYIGRTCERLPVADARVIENCILLQVPGKTHYHQQHSSAPYNNL